MEEIKGRAEEPLEIHYAESSLGQLIIASGAHWIRAVILGDDKDALYAKMREEFPAATLTEGVSDGQKLATAVVEHIETGCSAAELPLDLSGTEFQLRVWQALREIPVGSSATYTELAHRIDRPGAVRAVANACAANRIAVIIPCHRAIRRDGGMGGYRWGLERKVRLLEMERAASSSFRQEHLPVSGAQTPRHTLKSSPTVVALRAD